MISCVKHYIILKKYLRIKSSWQNSWRTSQYTLRKWKDRHIFGSYQKAEEAAEHKGDDDINCSWYHWDKPKRSKKETGGQRKIKTIQTLVLLRSSRILRKVLEIWGNLLSLRLQWKNLVHTGHSTIVVLRQVKFNKYLLTKNNTVMETHFINDSIRIGGANGVTVIIVGSGQG